MNEVGLLFLESYAQIILEAGYESFHNFEESRF